MKEVQQHNPDGRRKKISEKIMDKVIPNLMKNINQQISIGQIQQSYQGAL